MRDATLFLFILVMILIFGVLLLREDARLKRVTHRVAVATQPIHGDKPPAFASSVRRLPRWGDDSLLRLLLTYEPDALYNWPVLHLVLIGTSICLAVGIGTFMILPFWVAVIAGIVSGGLAVRTLLSWQRHRYADRLLRQLPDTLQLVVSAVRAGLPVAEAFHTIESDMPSPTRDQFALVRRELALGRTPEDALLAVYERTYIEEYAILSVTLAVQSKSGGRLAETLQILCETIRQRVILAGRARALAGESKIAARVLASIPFIAGIAMYFENRQNIELLFYDPRGHLLLAGGIVTLVLGIFTMQRMIRKATTV
jgi:tight adherence protein B